MGFERIYCATSTSASLLERNAWRLIEYLEHEGTRLAIFEKRVQEGAADRENHP
jgi:hypothetical protein